MLIFILWIKYTNHNHTYTHIPCNRENQIQNKQYKFLLAFYLILLSLNMISWIHNINQYVQIL